MLKLKNKLSKLGAYTSASLAVGMMSGSNAALAAPPPAAGKSFNDIGNNIIAGISNLPGVLTAVAYIMGVLFALLGILKIKDHVENPSNTPLKDGAIRLAIGGALFVMPLIVEAAQNLVGQGGAGVTAQSLQKVQTFNAVK
jgi:intracellular multiplication protein IcmD